jgi:hypothetical protein
VRSDWHEFPYALFKQVIKTSTPLLRTEPRTTSPQSVYWAEFFPWSSWTPQNTDSRALSSEVLHCVSPFPPRNDVGGFRRLMYCVRYAFVFSWAEGSDRLWSCRSAFIVQQENYTLAVPHLFLIVEINWWPSYKQNVNLKYWVRLININWSEFVIIAIRLKYTYVWHFRDM